MSNSAVVLEDLGICCALGANKEEVLQNALRGSQDGMCDAKDLLFDGTDTVVGRVKAQLPSIKQFAPVYHSRNNQIALLCLQQISQAIAKVKGDYGANRIAVVVGTSTSGIAEGERALAMQDETLVLSEDYSYRTQEMGALAEFVAHAAEVTGPSFSISTACSSSAQALISARELIQSNLADAVICGGVDSLCRLTLNGFYALESLDTKQCQPFSANRKGINIGEGGALFVMRKGATGIKLLGGGSASDAYHMSAPHPEGRGAKAAIEKACQEAGIAPAELGYVNLHGTATPLNDAMESFVLHELGASAVPASSTKGLTGHTLGAAGAIEAGLCWLLLSSLNTMNKIIPHVYDGESDPTISTLALAQGTERLKSGACLSNSFAFGGSNVSLILGKQ